MLNKDDRERLFRLNALLVAVPHPRVDGWGPTATASGLAGYDQDMRAIMPFYKKVIEGMIMEQAARDPENDLEEGWDYDDPDKLLTAMETWVKMRQAEDWKDANQGSMMALWKGMK